MSTFTLTGGLVGDILGGIASALAPGDDLETHIMCHNAIEEAELSYQSELMHQARMDYYRQQADQAIRGMRASMWEDDDDDW